MALVEITCGTLRLTSVSYLASDEIMTITRN
jgi:hypothetical protein